VAGLLDSGTQGALLSAAAVAAKAASGSARWAALLCLGTDPHGGKPGIGAGEFEPEAYCIKSIDILSLFS
jgi:hypothetical protein